MRQVRTIRYRDIAEDLRTRVEGGEFTAGRLLPSESELSATYSASRVTIRKALEHLRGEGLVDSRQGFGWFVAGSTVRQPLAHLATIEDQLEAEGRASERQILDFAFVRPPARVRAVLGVDKALKVRRINLADGEPFARVTVWCPEELGAELSRAQVQERSFYELLPVDFGGATQTIGADAASADDAHLLQVPVGSPVLVCERITADAAGTPVLIGEYVFPAHRTEFTVDLAHPEASIGPSGLRLVE
ncbi:MAG TPA: GntR family transcriptional regulator [Acidimicrobiales bacterium]|jgi:GntR family transcriptional regulator|nr:GntR family transcriptional regulator [Acidimicrobiales bacterium]